jgi:hypothetical protein
MDSSARVERPGLVLVAQDQHREGVSTPPASAAMIPRTSSKA